MSAPSRGLGKGLNALIPLTSSPQTAAGDAAPAGVLEVPVGAIVPNPWQPRTRIESEALQELTASIKEHGIIQPLIVTRTGATERTPYQLIAGERRWRAAQLAGLAVVPVLVKEASPQDALEWALVENVQRADLNALEEATAYQSLIHDFALSQQAVADRVGKSRVAVANTLRLLRLPLKVKALLAEGALSEGHARALLALPDSEAMQLAAEQVVARALTVRDTEGLVRRLLAGGVLAPKPAPEAETEAEARRTRRLEDAFRGALGAKVALTRGHQGGRLVISFFSEEELQTLYERIVGA
jgi:ParB family chromosome partitioning protein